MIGFLTLQNAIDKMIMKHKAEVQLSENDLLTSSMFKSYVLKDNYVFFY